MPNPDSTLLARAERRLPIDKEVLKCWPCVLQGLELGWLGRDEIRELLAELRQENSYGVQELQFEHRGDRLHVSFLDQQAVCSPAAMIKELEALIAP
ncbi:hypothetical protein [Cystobacter fuscus]|uniref:hypothetical protein n=1 Tax=Cystobacter fuscus TaxID=43 RepID=UPI002B29C324|nr:hypothetical protein F0U63_44160 [Cystobacter fuscus]